LNRDTSEFVKKQKAKFANGQNQNPSSLLHGLEEHYEPIRKGADKDPFNIQDRVFCKWACRMQTSVNGQVWFDCKELTFCENCGERVIILDFSIDYLKSPRTKYVYSFINHLQDSHMSAQDVFE
jgi:hypothetical protein